MQVGIRASTAIRTQLDPDALHAAALLDLLWADSAGQALERSITHLRTASALADRPAPALADLAAAHLVRAERTQSPRDLTEALDLAEHAVTLEPRNLEALFNRALALDWLTVDEQARAAWDAYLAVDSTSEWAGEARRRVAELRPARLAPAPGLMDAPAAAEAYARRAPQDAGLLGWDRLLPAWGDAVLRGDSVAARRHLALADAIGRTLERRGGDATLADAVRAIRTREGTGGAVRELAEAHRTYGAAREAYRRPHFARADTLLGRVLAARELPEPLGGWTRVFYAATRIYGGRKQEGLRLLRGQVAVADTQRHPALAARARWNLATTLGRDTLPEQALRWYGEAARLFARAGEREHLGTVQYLSSEAEGALGNPARGAVLLHQALVNLRPYRGSHWLHNALDAMSRQASSDGLARAALRLQEEDVAVARRNGGVLYTVEAHLSRARLRARAGDARRALGDLHQARTRIGMLPEDARPFFTATLQYTQALVARNGTPAAAAATLDSVVSFFGEGAYAEWLFQALVGRADARLALGRADAAEQDMDRVFALLEAQRAEVGGAAVRQVEQAARGIIEGVLLRRAAQGRAVEALAFAERAQAALAATGPRGGPAGVVPVLPAGRAAVRYALAGDTLFAWTVVGGEVHLARSGVGRERLRRSVERVRAALELGADSAAAGELATLYQWLVRPVQPRLGQPGGEVVLLPDPALAGVPFGALLDARTGRYWVQDHALRVGSSLRQAARAGAGPARADGAVVLVAPAFDPRSHPGLERLGGAGAEVAEVAPGYSRAVRLEGEEADARAVAAALRQATVFHFAGHAVSDDARPERSYLVVAPGQASDGGRLAAAEIERLDLRNVRVAVFSACHTLRAPDGGSGGFAGLGGALLGAGAQGVVGSLWRVDDARTQKLMAAFHHAYRGSGDPAAALRQAQLAFLGSPDPRLRAPSAWAGFQYAGR